MNIERRYEPEDGAMDRVVEILYRLLAMPEESAKSNEFGPAEHQDATCVPAESEG